MIFSPLITTYPSVADSVWTKVNTIPGRERKQILIVNFSTTVEYRYLLIPERDHSLYTVVSWAVYVNATYAGTAGKPLPANVYAQYSEDFQGQTTADVWVYQSSGGTLTSLSVDEGR